MNKRARIGLKKKVNALGYLVFKNPKKPMLFARIRRYLTFQADPHRKIMIHPLLQTGYNPISCQNDYLTVKAAGCDSTGLCVGFLLQKTNSDVISIFGIPGDFNLIVDLSMRRVDSEGSVW